MRPRARRSNTRRCVPHARASNLFEFAGKEVGREAEEARGEESRSTKLESSLYDCSCRRCQICCVRRNTSHSRCMRKRELIWCFDCYSLLKLCFHCAESRCGIVSAFSSDWFALSLHSRSWAKHILIYFHFFMIRSFYLKSATIVCTFVWLFLSKNDQK